MNQPEYSVVSEEIHLTEKLLACLIQNLQAQEVDLVVLSKELSLLEDMSIRIGNSIRECRQLVLEQELVGA